jgi:hypothetical protein
VASSATPTPGELDEAEIARRWSQPEYVAAMEYVQGSLFVPGG